MSGGNIARVVAVMLLASAPLMLRASGVSVTHKEDAQDNIKVADSEMCRELNKRLLDRMTVLKNVLDGHAEDGPGNLPERICNIFEIMQIKKVAVDANTLEVLRGLLEKLPEDQKQRLSKISEQVTSKTQKSDSDMESDDTCSENGEHVEVEAKTRKIDSYDEEYDYDYDYEEEEEDVEESDEADSEGSEIE